MKHLPCLIASALLTCAGVGIAQAGSHCETFAGKLTLMPLANCDKFQQIKRVERIFEDAVFLYDYEPPEGVDPPPPPLCFEGMISGSLGQRQVTATSLSALTVNAFAPPLKVGHAVQLFTAASVVTITETGKKAKELGSIFLRDMGVNFFPPGEWVVPYSSSEQLIGVGGTREFARASVSLQIEGNEFAGANVFGTVCR